jgi:hypothetical protein
MNNFIDDLNCILAKKAGHTDSLVAVHKWGENAPCSIPDR